jgi:hypothetical protein
VRADNTSVVFSALTIVVLSALTIACIIVTHNRMQNIKVIHARQASSINNFMNTKLKVLNCNVNIYFNRTCLDLNLIPKYAQVRIRSHNKTITRLTETQAAKLRIRNETLFVVLSALTITCIIVTHNRMQNNSIIPVLLKRWEALNSVSRWLISRTKQFHAT